MPKTRAQLDTDIDASFTDSPPGGITPAEARAVFHDMVLAAPNLADDGTPVPASRTVNGHALSANVTVSKSDVGLGAVPNTDATDMGNASAGQLALARGGTGAGTAAGAIDNLVTAETTVASAATTSLGGVASRNVSITGTTPITSFGTATAGVMRFGRFTGILTLTHNATSLILPNAGSNITTAANDRFCAVSLGSGNWLVYLYQKADGTSLAGGGGGSAAWGSISGTLSAQIDLATALGLKAPLAAPQITGNAQIDGQLVIKKTGSGDILLADQSGISISKPLTELVREITDADSATVLITDLVIDYKRTDSAPLVIPDPGDGSVGQHLKVTNSSDDPVNLNGEVTGSFFDGDNGVVNSLTVLAGEAICLFLENGPTTGFWRVLSRYSGATILQGVSSSSGAADAGKVTLLGPAGLLDPSFFPSLAGGDRLSQLLSTAIPITSSGNATIGRLHIVSGSGPITLTLPAVSGNDRKWVAIIVASTFTGLLTVEGNGSETINGALNQIMWRKESGEFYVANSAWLVQGGVRNAMFCEMSVASQNVGSGVGEVKILLDTAVEDNTGLMADIPNNRINTLRSGLVNVTGFLRFDAMAGTSTITQLIVRKTGNATAFIQKIESIVSGGYFTGNGSRIGPAIGTDYFELAGYQLSGATQAVGVNFLQVSEASSTW